MITLQHPKDPKIRKPLMPVVLHNHNLLNKVPGPAQGARADRWGSGGMLNDVILKHQTQGINSPNKSWERFFIHETAALKHGLRTKHRTEIHLWNINHKFMAHILHLPVIKHGEKIKYHPQLGSKAQVLSTAHQLLKKTFKEIISTCNAHATQELITDDASKQRIV